MLRRNPALARKMQNSAALFMWLIINALCCLLVQNPLLLVSKQACFRCKQAFFYMQNALVLVQKRMFLAAKQAFFCLENMLERQISAFSMQENHACALQNASGACQIFLLKRLCF